MRKCMNSLPEYCYQVVSVRFDCFSPPSFIPSSFLLSSLLLPLSLLLLLSLLLPLPLLPLSPFSGGLISQASGMVANKTGRDGSI